MLNRTEYWRIFQLAVKTDEMLDLRIITTKIHTICGVLGNSVIKTKRHFESSDSNRKNVTIVEDRFKINSLSTPISSNNNKQLILMSDSEEELFLNHYLNSYNSRKQIKSFEKSITFRDIKDAGNSKQECNCNDLRLRSSNQKSSKNYFTLNNRKNEYFLCRKYSQRNSNIYFPNSELSSQDSKVTRNW